MARVGTSCLDPWASYSRSYGPAFLTTRRSSTRCARLAALELLVSVVKQLKRRFGGGRQSERPRARSAQIVIVGLNGAGKTTILYKLHLGDVVVTQACFGPVPRRWAATLHLLAHASVPRPCHVVTPTRPQPTIGSNVEEVTYKNVKFQARASLPASQFWQVETAVCCCIDDDRARSRWDCRTPQCRWQPLAARVSIPPAHARTQVWDLGGQENLRPSWRTYYTDTKAVILVVDSADQVRRAPGVGRGPFPRRPGRFRAGRFSCAGVEAADETPPENAHTHTRAHTHDHRYCRVATHVDVCTPAGAARHGEA